MVPQNEKYCIFLVHIVGSVLVEFRFAVHHLNNTIYLNWSAVFTNCRSEKVQDTSEAMRGGQPTKKT